ncbi:MAG: hypothetical protein RLZZ137_802 [Cyanobacteriota bacterium]|jgi:hypothetical protein
MAGSMRQVCIGCSVCKGVGRLSRCRSPFGRIGGTEKPAFVDLQANDAFLSATAAAAQSHGEGGRRGPSIRLSRGTAAEQILASELKGRQQSSDALSMMVSSMVHMVQAGKTTAASSRWSA